MRDEFPGKVRSVLAKRAGERCSNPSCPQATSGPHEDPGKAINVGVAAHITAASPKGPRYNEALTRKERSSSKNGIWLCQTCAKLVDNDPIRYPKETLEEWKQQAEQAARAELESGRRSMAPDQLDTDYYEAMREIAADSPYEAILYSWASLEAAVLEFLRRNDQEVGDDPPTRFLIKTLRASGRIDGNKARLVSDLYDVRNESLSYPKRFDYNDAMAYADHTAKLIIALARMTAT